MGKIVNRCWICTERSVANTDRRHSYDYDGSTRRPSNVPQQLHATKRRPATLFLFCNKKKGKYVTTHTSSFAVRRSKRVPPCTAARANGIFARASRTDGRTGGARETENAIFLHSHLDGGRHFRRRRRRRKLPSTKTQTQRDNNGSPTNSS